MMIEKIDKYLNEAVSTNLATIVLMDALKKLGFKRVGQVMTASTKGNSPKAVLKQAQQLVGALNMLEKTSWEVKLHDSGAGKGFIDITL